MYQQLRLSSHKMQGVFPHGISEISGVFCEYFGQIKSFYNVNALYNDENSNPS